MKYGTLIFLVLVIYCTSLPAVNDANLVLTRDEGRGAFFRGETATFIYKVENLSDCAAANVVLTVGIDGISSDKAQIERIAGHSDILRTFRFDTSKIKSGKYELTCTLQSCDKPLATDRCEITIARRWNPERMRVWLWPHRKFGLNVYQLDDTAKEQLAWWADKGLNSFCPGSGTGFANRELSNGMLKLYDYMMAQGMEAGFEVSRGYFEDINDPAVQYKPAREFSTVKTLCDPFNPKVAQRQNYHNRELMRKISQYPGVGVCYFESEYVDFLADQTPLAPRYAQEPLGPITPHQFIMPGVIADTDEGYVRHMYRLKWGDGLVVANRRAADMVHRYRPDMFVFTDPFRSEAIYDRFVGLDGVSSWTYVNPDLKMMLYVETLIAAAKPARQKIAPIVTLLNYPGTIYPKDKGWPLMGPDELVETSWINLSRRPDVLGYYPSSEGDPFEVPDRPGVEKTWEEGAREPYQRYPKTFEAMKQFTETIVKPYGPCIGTLERMPRHVAVLSSESSRIYSSSPTLLGFYPNYQVYCFYTLLNMIHIPADIVFDETVSDFGLDGYDVLVLPKCDTLTKAVYDRIMAFQKRGGVVISDQYLRAPLENVTRFNFDFTYRDKVSADAIISNKAYAAWDDHIDVKTATTKDVNGVSAEDDQRIMEGYADALRTELNGKIQRAVDCSSPTALLNMLSADDARYLFVANDKRIYGDRIGAYKAMLEKVVPQTVTITLNEKSDGIHVFDMISRKELPVAQMLSSCSFDVNLSALGGTIVFISNQKFGNVDIVAPKTIKLSESTTIQVLIKDSDGILMRGSQPVSIVITDPKGKRSEYSDYYVARNGRCFLTFTAAINDFQGVWTIHAQELITGITRTVKFRVN